MNIKEHAREAKVEAKNDLSSSAEAKGERLRRVRHLANLSREEFCNSDINLSTLISWEIGRFGGLSPKGANRVIARVAREGVFVTPEWLLYEVGVGPEVLTDYKKQSSSGTSEKTNIIEELMVFRKLNQHAVDFIIEDDAMLPHYRPGDYVAGTRRFASKIKSLIGVDCIIEVTDGRIFMRNLHQGPQENSFNLVPTNLQSKKKDAIIFDVELVSAAPVLWHRKRDEF